MNFLILVIRKTFDLGAVFFFWMPLVVAGLSLIFLKTVDWTILLFVMGLLIYMSLIHSETETPTSFEYRPIPSPHMGIQEREHSEAFDVLEEEFDPSHLPVNEEIVQAFLDHPATTYADLDALYFSMCNSEMTGCHPLAEKVQRRAGELASAEYRRKP